MLINARGRFASSAGMALVLLALFVWTACSEAAARRRPPRMTMEATAYCLRGNTATGATVGHGTVAADPRVLPFGSRVHVRGRGVDGAYVVEDSGPNVKGRRIDIFMPRCDRARDFGRQRVTVTVERLGVPVPATR